MRKLTPGMCLMVVVFGSLARDGEGADASAFRYAGSIRVRQEVIDGQFRPGFNEQQDLFSMRTILLGEWKRNNWRIGAELYDSRSYGAGQGDLLTTTEVNALEFVQAYVARDFPAAFGKDTSATLTAGRFVMNLGSRRLVAADDYRNTTNGYTGLRAEMKLADKTAMTLYYTLPQERIPDTLSSLRNNGIHFDRESLDLQLWGLLAAKPGLPGGMTGEIGYVRLLESDSPERPTRNRDLHSLTARLMRDPAPDRMDFEIEGIYQTGDMRRSVAGNAALQDADAWFVHADVGHTFSNSWRSRLALEYDYASGDGPDADFGRFDTIFGMRRADFGPSGIYAAIGRTNLQTVGLRLETTPSQRLDAFAVYRALWAAAATDSFSTTGVRDPTGASGRFAGYQLEGRLRYWIIPQSLRTEFNGAWLQKRGLLRDAPNATPYGNTLYLSLALTLSF
jgi:Alginate export